VISPGFWIYFFHLYKGLSPQYSASLNLAGIVDPSLANTPGAIQFDLLELEDLASIDWKRRPLLTKQFKVMDRLIRKVSEMIRSDLQESTSLDIAIYAPQSLDPSLQNVTD